MSISPSSESASPGAVAAHTASVAHNPAHPLPPQPSTAVGTSPNPTTTSDAILRAATELRMQSLSGAVGSNGSHHHTNVTARPSHPAAPSSAVADTAASSLVHQQPLTTTASPSAVTAALCNSPAETQTHFLCERASIY